MNLFRIALTVIIAGVLWLGLRLIFRIFAFMAHAKAAVNQHQQQASGNARHLDSNTMVKCATCQLYILEQDAIISTGKAYCCKDHIA